jgi:hypothetical protein
MKLALVLKSVLDRQKLHPIVLNAAVLEFAGRRCFFPHGLYVPVARGRGFPWRCDTLGIKNESRPEA